MADFCTSCGSPTSGRFCTQCGAAGQQAPAETQVPAAAPGPRKSAGSKMLLIVLGGLLLLGGMGIGTVAYVAYRAKQKITQLAQEYGIEKSGTNLSTRKFPPSQGSGCKMLEGQEAAQVLGVAVSRAEYDPNGPNGSSECRYWVSAAERQRLIGEEMASSIAGLGKADTKNGEPTIENLIGGGAGALNEANSANKDSDYAFSLQLWPKNGKEQWQNMELAQTRAKDAFGAGAAGVAMQSVDGIGDRAIELPAGHSIMVLKNDTFFLLGFQQFVPGREKTAALARIVAGRT
jgi:hypothetical protein